MEHVCGCQKSKGMPYKEEQMCCWPDGDDSVPTSRASIMHPGLFCLFEGIHVIQIIGFIGVALQWFTEIVSVVGPGISKQVPDRVSHSSSVSVQTD
jgi:hypothetical protein